MSRFKFKRSRRRVPGLNTASLPDLIFTVLFFFMIVTHMRKQEVQVKYRVPQGKELARLAKKSAVTYIYIGKPVDAQGAVRSDRFMVQVNDRLCTPEELTAFLSAERAQVAPEDLDKLTVSLKADKDVPMSVVAKVKQALREANMLKINYSASEQNDTEDKR